MVTPIYEMERLCRMGLYETAWIIEGKYTHAYYKNAMNTFDQWFNAYKIFSGLR